MGGPDSSSLAICVSCYSEYNFIVSIDTDIKYISSFRYVDDKFNLLVYDKHDNDSKLHAESLLRKLNESYPPELELEVEEIKNNSTKFLECHIHVHDDQVKVIPLQKNYEHILEFEEQKFFKISSFLSYSSRQTKIGVIISLILRKLSYSSSTSIFMESIRQTFIELKLLCYPKSLVYEVINKLCKRDKFKVLKNSMIGRLKLVWMDQSKG